MTRGAEPFDEQSPNELILLDNDDSRHDRFQKDAPVICDAARVMPSLQRPADTRTFRKPVPDVTNVIGRTRKASRGRPNSINEGLRPPRRTGSRRRAR